MNAAIQIDRNMNLQRIFSKGIFFLTTTSKNAILAKKGGMTMYCSQCGSAVQDGARFCSKCGNALSQNDGQPNAYQSTAHQPATHQPAASHNSAPKKFGVNVVFPDGHNEIGDVYLSETEIAFVKKSKFIRIAFGFLASALEKGAETLRLNISDIASGKRTRLGLDPCVYQITMKNGDIYHFCFNLPTNIAHFEAIIGK